MMKDKKSIWVRYLRGPLRARDFEEIVVRDVVARFSTAMQAHAILNMSLGKTNNAFHENRKTLFSSTGQLVGGGK